MILIRNLLRKCLLACALGVVAATITLPAAVRAEEAASQPVTADGRKFADLSESDVDSLPRPEKKRYYAWMNARMDAEAAEREKRIARMEAEAIVQEREIKEQHIEIVHLSEEMLANFMILHNAGSRSDNYWDLKKTLRKQLETRNPPEMVSKLEAIRSILTAPEKGSNGKK